MRPSHSRFFVHQLLGMGDVGEFEKTNLTPWMSQTISRNLRAVLICELPVPGRVRVAEYGRYGRLLPQDVHLHFGQPRALAAQSSEPGRAFGNALSHVCRCVEVPRFFPQPSRLFHLAGVFFEYRQRPKRVREVEWRRFLVAPVKCERLVVARLGQFRPTRILMDVTQMSNRVCQGERIAFFAANGDRFLVQGSRCIATP